MTRSRDTILQELAHADAALAKAERTRDTSAAPFRDLRLDQFIRGILVARGFLAVRIDESTGLVKSMRAFFNFNGDHVMRGSSIEFMYTQKLIPFEP